MNVTQENIIFGRLDKFIAHVDVSSFSSVLIVSGDNKHEAAAAATIYKSISEAKNITVNTMSIPSSEAAKGMAILEILWNMFLKFGLDRHSLIISVGGGAISDCVGFAASTYMRGVCFASVPTTILAACDACIGGKRAIDLPGAKNSVGSFWFASFVFIDVETFDTLSDVQYRSGIAEVLKTAFVTGGELFDICSQLQVDTNSHLPDVLNLCIKAKQKIVSDDPYDTQYKRTALNYGHTFGHAIEAACNYAIPHGLCVALGMDIVASNFAPDICRKQRNILKKFDIDVEEIFESSKQLVKDADSILANLKSDKKSNAGDVDIVVVKKFGRPEKIRLSADRLKDILINYKNCGLC